MIKIDITLRDVISSMPHKFIELLTGKKGVKLLDTSLPEVKDKRADLIVELEDQSIFHLEVQSFNDKNMNLRMLEYYILIMQKYKNDKILQKVLYVGEKPLNMPDRVQTDVLNFTYQLVDIRKFNCESLISSKDIEDKILAVLCDIKNENRYINVIIEEILNLPENKRKDYIKKLLSLSRYRKNINEKLLSAIKEKVMPITINLQDDPYFQQGIQQGIKQGIQQGIQQGIKKGIQKAVKVLKELNLSNEEIAKKLNISKKEVNEFLKDSNETPKNR